MRPAPMTVHLEPEEREALDRIAREQSRSRGNVIRLALRRYIETEQRRQTGKEERMQTAMAA